MVDQDKVEQIFDIINEACVYLFEKCKMNYLDSLIETTKSIVEGDVCFDLDDEFIHDYNLILAKMNDNYNAEEVRKALQFLIMNALKEVKSTNTITPDTIAFLMNYLSHKFLGDKKITILDPLVGSANLLSAIGNYRDDVRLYGIDSDEVMIKLASMMSDMQNIEMILYNQNTFEVLVPDVDLIVSDVPSDIDLTYHLINHHMYSLNDDGYMILLLDNRFFTEINQELKEQINEQMVMVGLIELPDSFFINNKKSILIMKKSKVRVKEFLLATMPDTKDSVALNSFLSKIEQWFIKERM